MERQFVLFDMDGTLADTSEGIFVCFGYAFRKMGLQPPAESELSLCVGPPLLDSFLKFFDGDRRAALLGVAAYRERYAAEGWRECALYPGVEECLSLLVGAGIGVGLATCKPQPFAERILERFKIAGYFSTVVGSKLDNSFDDKAKIIALALQKAKASPAASAMVGDRASDMIGARKNGVLPVGVRFGFALPGELESAGAAWIADDYPALGRFFLYSERK